MKLAKLSSMLLASATLVFGFPAYAGTAIHGYGDSKLAAMADANRNAEVAARDARTCITSRATPQSCVLNSGVWDCYAIIANHQGSC